MKVLFFCYDHYPYAGACSSLLDKLFHAGNLKNELDEIHVLTVKYYADERDLENVDGITIHRVLPLSRLTIKEIGHIFLKKPILSIRAMLFKLWCFVRSKVLKIETLVESDSANAVLRKLKQLENEHYDIAVSVHGVYKIGAAVMKYFERTPTKTVVYQLDPCATNLCYSNKLQAKAIALEKQLFDSADAIITTPLLLEDVRIRYSDTIIKKSYAMEFPNIDCAQAGHDDSGDKGYNCLYAGSIYAGIRNPKHTIEVFNAIKNPAIKLRFVGTSEQQILRYVNEEEIGKRFSFCGPLPIDDARAEINKAAILVNIGNVMTNQVPSKIFEYISARKPIINICANSDCPSLIYLKKYPLAFSVVEGVGSVQEHADEIENFVLKNAGKTVSSEWVLKQFKECTAEFCAKQMLAIFTKIQNDRACENM